MKLMSRDVKVAVFYSTHMRGDVNVEYCEHRQMLVLRYWSKDGVMAHDYDVAKPSEMRDLVLDAIDLAAKSLKERS